MRGVRKQRTRRRGSKLAVLGGLVVVGLLCAGTFHWAALGSARATGGYCYADWYRAYLLHVNTSSFPVNDYRTVHVQDWDPGTALAAGNDAFIEWRAQDPTSQAAIDLFLTHNDVGDDVASWTTVSAGGTTHSGTYGVIPADSRFTIQNHSPNWDAYVNGVKVASVQPSTPGSVYLRLAGESDSNSAGACNSLDLRFDGGVPGSGSYYPDYPNGSPCGNSVGIGSVPLSCTKGVQIRFYN